MPPKVQPVTIHTSADGADGEKEEEEEGSTSTKPLHGSSALRPLHTPTRLALTTTYEGLLAPSFQMKKRRQREVLGLGLA